MNSRALVLNACIDLRGSLLLQLRRHVVLLWVGLLSLLSLRCTLLGLLLSYRLRLLLPLRGRCLLILLEAVLGLWRGRRAIRWLSVDWLLWCCRRRWTFLCRWAGLLSSICPTFAAGFHLRPVRIYCGHRRLGSLKIPLHMVRHNGLLLLVSCYTGLHRTSLVNDLIAFRQNRMSLNAPGLMLLLWNAQDDAIKLLLRSGHELRKTLPPSCVTCLRALALLLPRPRCCELRLSHLAWLLSWLLLVHLLRLTALLWWSILSLLPHLSCLRRT